MWERIKATWSKRKLALGGLAGAVFVGASLLMPWTWFSGDEMETEAPSLFPSLQFFPQSPRTAEDDSFIPPPPISLELMKKKGCVADGLLSGYGGNTDKIVDLINRSECAYLHRALETWLAPPDFDEAAKIMADIEKPDMLYGMFIAEAIDTKANYYSTELGRDFEFDRMCRPGSKNFWGEHTCKPYFKREEYRLYLRQITREAIDHGITTFLFGQIFYQDEMDKPWAGEIVHEMRDYAAFQGKSIVIGAQTNDIDDKDYLRLFDYIEGGVGIDATGDIEKGPCFSRWYQKDGDWCWALLWHKRFADKANNVIVHLDWSGRHGDDMSTFARMDQEGRLRTLRTLHKYFTDKDIGFLVPFLAVLPNNNGGCYGTKIRSYTPDQEYGCPDEDGINAILKNVEIKATAETLPSVSGPRS